MSLPHYGDRPQDPQDAAKEDRIEKSWPSTPDEHAAADWHDGKPLPTVAAPDMLKLLQGFCSNEESRPLLSKPFNAGCETCRGLIESHP